MAFRVIVTPWFNKKEWQEVAAKIYSDDLDEMLWAIDMVTVWEQRVGTNLDRNIKITADLVLATYEIQSMDPEDIPDKSAQLQIMHSMVIVRFINFIRHKYKKKLPVTVALNKAGLPESLASFHHDANHNFLPSLDLLRQGVQTCMDWLQEHYWVPQDGLMEDYIPPPPPDYSSLLNNYQTAAYEMLVRKQSDDNLMNIIARLKEVATKENYRFFDTLASPGHLLPPTFYLTTLEQAKGECYEASVDQLRELPPLAKALWKPLLALINKQHLLQLVVESLLLVQGRFSPQADRMIITWVSYLLTLDSTVGWIIPAWNWKPLLHCALSSPCKYILEILPVFLENQDPPMSEEKKEKVVTLAAVYFGALTDYSVRDISDDKLYTYKDLEAMQHGKQLEKDPKSNPSIWTRYIEPDPLNPPPLGTFIVEPAPEDPPTPAKADMPPVVAPMARPLRPQHRHLPLNDPDLKVKPCSPSLLEAVEEFLNETLLP